MILYRPVGLQELELIYDSGMKTFPARLPQQPIFYPVLPLEYARQIAADWNAKSGQSAGYVTQFKVEDQYIDRFEKHTVGTSQHQEFWIPTEELEEFNKHILGHIKVVEAYFGDAFEGFVPDQFGLQGKNAVDQFTELANTYIYKRMDFYLEIKRNHKAVFLNYPFWQTYEFKNPVLKEKIIKAIREAWLTSFPKTPLPNPVQEDVKPAQQPDTPSFANPIQEDTLPPKQGDLKPSIKPRNEDVSPVKPTASYPVTSPIQKKITPLKPRDPEPLANPVNENITPIEQANSHPLVNRVPEPHTPVKQTISNFSQGLELGLSGKYQEAIAELSKAVGQDPRNAAVHTSLGVAFHRVGEDDRALTSYSNALKIDPQYADAHYFRANILYARGDVREAIAAYTRAIGLRPELVDAHQEPPPQNRLTDYTGSPAGIYRIVKPAHRILDLNRVLETNPSQPNLLKERAAEYSRLGNYEQAVADYSSSLKLQPDDASVLHLRGLAYEQMGQFDQALEDYQQAIKIDPQLSDIYINRGVILGQMGNFRQSIVSLSEGIRLNPQSPDIYFNRGTSYFKIGDFNSAIEDFSTVVKLSPLDEEAYYWRGIAHEEVGHQREAITDYEQFLAISQNSGARNEIEKRLSELSQEKPKRESKRSAAPDENPKTTEQPNQNLDLYDLITALGERALNSTWLASGVGCYGERVDELYAYVDNNKPIPGRDLLDMTTGIRQTVEGDFTAFDEGAGSHWLFIRAWDGNGFYIETSDPRSKERLMTQFPLVEEVEETSAPYEGLFIHI